MTDKELKCKTFSSMSDTLRVVKLHECPQLLNDCALLLNDEWPRSLTARLHSLQKSCDSLPISLILVNNENRLLGHIRIKKEFMDTDCVFIESLVIEKSERGKGLGKLLMNFAEDFIREMSFKKISLTTTDQMAFYTRLGFQFTSSNQTINNNNNNRFNDRTKTNEKQSQIEINANINKTSVPLPPPPPPLPSLTISPAKSQLASKVLMHKYI